MLYSILTMKPQTSSRKKSLPKILTESKRLNIEKISNELKIEGKQIYFKLIVGSNSYTSQTLKKNQKLFTIQVKQTLYAQDKQNKLILVFFSKDFIGESVVCFGHLSLDSLLSGQRKISLTNEAKDDIGFAILNLNHRTIPCKIIDIENIALNFYEDGDLIGQSQPFVVAKIGSCSGSTQIGQSNRLTFKRGIQLKYSNDKFLEMQIWDQDLTVKELLYTEKVKLSQLKNKGQHEIIYKGQTGGRLVPKAKLAFEYQIKIIIDSCVSKNCIKQDTTEIKSKKIGHRYSCKAYKS